MKRLWSWRGTAIVLAASLMAVACSEGSRSDGSSPSSIADEITTTDAPLSRSEVVHTFEGRDFTCEQALGVDPSVGCDDGMVAVWEQRGADLTGFINSGELGPLNDEAEFSFEDVAFAGVVACSIRDSAPLGDEQDFIEFMQAPSIRAQLNRLSGTELLPVWFAAGQYLCPPTGRDQETP